MKSQYIASARVPLSKLSIYLFKRFNNFEVVDPPDRKSICLSDRTFTDVQATELLNFSCSIKIINKLSIK